MPNNLPLNWCECKLGDVFKTSSGGTPSRKETSYYGGDIPWLKSGELNDGIISEAEEFITKEGLENSSAKIFPKGSILLALYGATVGKIGILDFDSATNQAVCCIYSNPYFDKNLLFYYLLSQRKHLINQGKGGAQPNISQDIVKNLVLPLPPMAEQERIVEKIEALFADIDEGVENLKTAQAQIKQYRQSVLKSAFEGKLYKTTEWKETQLKNIIDSSQIGVVRSTGEQSTQKVGIPYVKMNNITLDGMFNINNIVYVQASSDEIKKYSLKNGDILFNTRNSYELVGKNAIVYNINKPMIYNNNLMRIRTKSQIDSKFLVYQMNSTKFKNCIKRVKKATTNICALYSKDIFPILINIPTLLEQQRIVEEIEKRFTVADELEKTINDGLEKAKQLKQSILKKAFSGQLVPQDPNDEPASILLDRIKKEKQSQTKGKKR